VVQLYRRGVILSAERILPPGRIQPTQGANSSAHVPGRTYDSQVCSIARALEQVGERWSLLIIRDALFGGLTRYNDFQRRLGIATNILKDRLEGFVAAGIMERREYSGQPELHEYVLTGKGRDLAATLIALTEWGDRSPLPRFRSSSDPACPPASDRRSPRRPPR
jgi:DNA-binding HxlR family transcriptional regulator